MINISYSFVDAKEEYESLKKELTAMNRRKSYSQAEEGHADSEDFNLDEYLHGVKHQIDQNGHKKKNLGVSWENLHIEVKNYNFIHTWF